MNNKFIEEISLNQWQPLQTMLYDGWVLRFANGYTKRANSVNPIYTSTVDPNEKIAACERIYAAHHLKTVFKITPFVQPANLDEMLENRGYSLVDPTAVQILDLKTTKPPTHYHVEIDRQIGEAWLENFCQLNQIEDNAHQKTMKQMLDNLVADKGFFTLYEDGKVAACALGMIERNWIGIFDVVTSLDYRNRGIGEQLLLHLLQWGKVNGAKHSYLAVVLNNKPALRLYSKLGFKEIYRYWYRVREV